MGHNSRPIKVSRDGRFSIPANQRKALGLEGGGMVVASVEDGELRIRTIQAIIAEIQDLAATYLNDARITSDMLIAERREEAAREAMEFRDHRHARGS